MVEIISLQLGQKSCSDMFNFPSFVFIVFFSQVSKFLECSISGGTKFPLDFPKLLVAYFWKLSVGFLVFPMICTKPNWRVHTRWSRAFQSVLNVSVLKYCKLTLIKALQFPSSFFQQKFNSLTVLIPMLCQVPTLLKLLSFNEDWRFSAEFSFLTVSFTHVSQCYSKRLLSHRSAHSVRSFGAALIEF